MAAHPEVNRDPSSALPLNPVDVQILLVLTGGNLHGYGLMKAVEEQSGGKVRLEVGSLYRVIKRLIGNGLIEESKNGPGAATASPIRPAAQNPAASIRSAISVGTSPPPRSSVSRRLAKPPARRP